VSEITRSAIAAEARPVALDVVDTDDATRRLGDPRRLSDECR
jgi:hypothetical protein